MKPGVNRGQRTVGLDKPCQMCGRPIYYAYQGPYEGVCGRCTDRMKRKSRRRRRRQTIPVRQKGTSARRALVIVLVALLAGALVWYFGRDHILDLIR